MRFTSCLRPATLLKKRLEHRCFPVNFAKFLRTPFFTEHLWWLLLQEVELVGELILSKTQIISKTKILKAFHARGITQLTKSYVIILDIYLEKQNYSTRHFPLKMKKKVFGIKYAEQQKMYPILYSLLGRVKTL